MIEQIIDEFTSKKAKKNEFLFSENINIKLEEIETKVIKVSLLFNSNGRIKNNIFIFNINNIFDTSLVNTALKKIKDKPVLNILTA